MNDEFENAKLELKNVEQLADIKENPIVKATILSIIKSIPIIGGLIDDSIDATLTNFQNEKRDKLIELILSDSEKITSDMVNDIEFIMNFARTIEAVNKLATNDKIIYFAMLIQNGYFTQNKIDNDTFEEYISIINTLSYREIQYISFLYNFQKANHKKNVSSDGTYFNNFGDEFSQHFGVGKYDYIDIFKKLAFTGFVQEFYDLYSGSITKNPPSEYGDEFTISGGEIYTDYFWITESFKKFIERIENV